MNHHEFFEFLKKWRDYKKYPPAIAWPREIIWGGAFWTNIKKLYDNTAVNNFEYETSFFYAEGNIVGTDPYKGERTSVKAGHNLNIKFIPKSGGYYDKQTLLDDKVIKLESVKAEKIPKEFKLGFLFNAHSHPVHYLGDPENPIKTYGFFSDTDINSLLYGENMVAGLVTDEFWLAAKTDRAIKQIGEVGSEMLQNVSNQAYAGDKYLEDVIRSQMQNWGLVFYRAKFGQVLKRVI